VLQGLGIVWGRRYRVMGASRIRQRSTVDWTTWHAVTRISGVQFIGVDPEHRRHRAAQCTPLVLTN
jgi:hypothetical protein